MDWSEAVWGIGRDLGELAAEGPGGWLAIALFGMLPVAATFVAVILRRRAAWLALALWLAPVITWVLYYATDWWPNQGMQGIVFLALPVLAGWLVLAVVVATHRRARRIGTETTPPAPAASR